MTVSVKRKRVAIISTYKVFCGIAYNAEIIKRSLEKYYDVDVLPINPEFVKTLHPRDCRKAAEKYLIEIAQKSNEYDYVNIQLEGGIFGSAASIIWPRVNKMLSLINKPIILTMHCSYVSYKENLIIPIIKSLMRFKLKPFIMSMLAFSGYFKAKNFWLKLKKKKRKACIVYNKVEEALFTSKLKINSTYTHPLCYYTTKEKQKFKSEFNRDSLIKSHIQLNSDDVIIGVFGFFTSYKGFTDSINALRFLPKNFKLILAGGTNITAIKDNSVDKYLETLLEVVKEYGLEERVIFTGTLSDEMVPLYVQAVDVVVFPYAETNQVASGPFTMAIELAKKKIVASYISTFKEQGKFYPGLIEFYNIGNYFDLAQKIIGSNEGGELDKTIEIQKFNIETQSKLYKEVWEDIENE